jgi:hypothetical protein
MPLANMHKPQVLFSDQETIDCIKAATASLKDDGKKFILPDVVLGFKASSLEVSESLSFLKQHMLYVVTFHSLISLLCEHGPFT